MYKKLIHLFSFILLLSIVLSSAAEAVDPSLIGWWRFDEGAGMTAADSSGNGNNGTLQSDPQWVVGQIGKALQFDGVDDYVEIQHDDVLTVDNEVTVMAWINAGRYNAPNGDAWQGIIGKQEGQRSYNLYTEASGALHFSTAGYGGLSDPIVPLNEWMHACAMVREGTHAYFINGEPAGENGSGITLPGTADTANLMIGRTNEGAARSFLGMIDDVRIYSRALTQEEVQVAMQGEVTYIASAPGPGDGVVDVRRDVVLSWTPGPFAATHDVYFGTTFDDANDADRTNPLDVLVSQSQDANTYDPDGLLEIGRIYYWRIDEVNASPDLTTFKGDVWSFTAEPLAYPIPGENITVTASSYEEDKEPENTINGSGLDDSGLLHSSIGSGNMWLSSRDANQPTWIQYEFDKAYIFHQMWVWNTNESLEPVIGLGFKDVTIEYSVNGADYITLGTTHEFAQAPGTNDYAHNTTIEFNGVAAKYIRLTANSNWGGILNQYGLSEVRFLQIPVNAREPSPASGATDVALEVSLGWRAGREAVEHNVYFSDDMQAVIDGTAGITTVTDTSYAPLPLDLGKTYYWRVDEVNGTDVWEGEIWDFTTREYFVVDDFEDYNDYEPDRIFDAWIDGWGIATNGSTVGYESPNFIAGEHFVETVIVHGGEQSMPLFYDNTTASNSEVSANTNNLAIGSDWSKGSPEKLVLWFYGATNNSTTEQMYVRINSTEAEYEGDAGNIAKRRWHQWSIDLASLNNVDLSNVTTIAIGFDGVSATGAASMVFIDDIRLYRTPPPELEPVDPGTDGLIAYYPLDGDVLDASGNELHGTIVGEPNFVEGMVGMGLQIDGVDDYVDCGNDPIFDLTEQITLAAWVNINDIGNGEDDPWVGKGDTSYMLKGYREGNQIEFFIYDGGWNVAHADVDESFNNTWHHAAGTFDGERLIIYVDGEVAATSDYVGGIMPNTYNVAIGTNTEAADRFSEGIHDEVIIYNRALSAGEVLYLADQ